jgi:hypothetical protein
MGKFMQRLALRTLAAVAVGLLAMGRASAQTPEKESLKSDTITQYNATLDRGLAEAKRRGKPTLFVSSAPHCAGVSGMW